MRGLTRALVAALLVASVLPATARATTRVIGGGDATIEQAPYQVALVVKDNLGADDHYGQFCGGTLVTPSRVVTAAHCVFDSLNFGTVYLPEQVEVLAGAADLADAADGQRRDVASVAFDPQYEPLTGEHDVAVLTLATAVTATPEVQPIALISPGEAAQLGPDDNLFISGWGNTADPPAEQFPTTLQRAVVHLVDDATCGASYTAAGFAFDPQLMLCAGAKTDRVVDTCQGDSGGPLAMDVSSDRTPLYRLVGVTSFGNGCAVEAFPGVYADLTTASLRDFAVADHGTPPGTPDTFLRDVTVGSSPTVGEPLGCSASEAPEGTHDDGYRWFRYAVDAGIEPVTPLITGDPTYEVTAGDLGNQLICAVQTSDDDGYTWDYDVTSQAVQQPSPPTPQPSTPPAQKPPVQKPPAEPVLPPSNPPAADVLAPIAKVSRASCRRGRCVIDLRVSDPDAPAPAPAVRASVRSAVSATCRKRAKRVRCIKHSSRTLKVRIVAPGRYRIDVRLPRGTHRFVVVAKDRAGHATTVRRTLKRR